MIEFSGKTIHRYSFDKKFSKQENNMKNYQIIGKKEVIKFVSEKFSDCELSFDKETEVIFINCSFSSKCKINGSYVRMIDCEIKNKKRKYEFDFKVDRLHITNLKDNNRNRDFYGNMKILADSVILSNVLINSSFSILSEMATFVDTSINNETSSNICCYVLGIFNSLLKVKNVDYIDLYFKDSKLYNNGEIYINGRSYLREYDVFKHNNYDRYYFIFLIDELFKRIYVSELNKNNELNKEIDLRHKKYTKLTRSEYLLKVKELDDKIRQLEEEKTTLYRENLNNLNNINALVFEEKERVRTRKIGGMIE